MGKITSTRYLRNAKGILRTVPIEDDTYTDIKPVQEACSTAYLTILKAIDDYLLKKGDFFNFFLHKDNVRRN